MKLIPGTPLSYRRGELFLEECSLREIASEVDTPVFVYSRRHLEERFREYDRALEGLDHLVCYGMKALGNVSIVRLLGQLGAGVDLVSGGELYRAQRAGIPAERMVFSGVGKTEREIREAIRCSILMLNVESQMELQAISRIAVEENRKAGVSIRINPDIDAHTHPYISTGLEENKFGIPFEEGLEMYQEADELPGIEIRGLQCHIGSQITDIKVFGEAVDRLIEVDETLKQHGIEVSHFDIGGGLGISYDDRSVPGPQEMIAMLRPRFEALGKTILVEPGRSIVGNCGVLLTRVVYYKENRQKRFAIVDGGMTELLRPALYGAHHEIVPVVDDQREAIQVDVAGPVCESSDVLAKDCALPRPRPGDLYAVLSTGAYGFSMAGNYNSRLRPPEVLIEGDSHRLIRRRESYQDLVDLEVL